MHRAPLLLVCLSLAFMTLAPLTTPVVAQEALPAEFLGRWEGPSDELPTNAVVPVTVDLTGGSLGTVVGTMALPNHACGGNVTLQRVAADGSQIELAVTITFGTACIDGGIVTLTLQPDGSVFYDWRHPTIQVSATGTLTRSGGPPAPASAPTTGSPPQAPVDAACQAEALAARAGTPSLAGPFYGSLEQGSGTITLVSAETTAEAFWAGATFVNPTDGSTVPWDFGFAFHEAPDRGAVQQIFLVSPGTWYYASYPSGALESGAAPSFDATPGAANTLDLLVAGETASLCVNGQFVATMPLPPAMASDVYLATGFLNQSIVDGRVMGYQDFEIWALPAAIAQAQRAGACEWTGTWDTPYGPLRLTQTGGTVSGDYDWDQGQISDGVVSGTMLGGIWTEAPSRQPPSDAGKFRFTMAEGCQAFTGIWRYDASGEWLTGWSGQRRSS